MRPTGRAPGRPRRAALSACLACLWTLGCGAPGGGGAPAPRAIVVGPALDAGAAGATPIPAAPSGDEPPPFDLVFGMNKTCLRAGGRVHCTADFSPDRPLTSAPPVEGIDDAVQLAMASDFGCVVTRAGTVQCFGDNNRGQLGARLRAAKSEKPVTVVGVERAKRVIAAEGYACALLGDGTVRCWGRNESGQTGSATSYLPAARELIEAEVVVGVKDVKGLTASGTTTCATGPAHDVTCWGRSLLGGNDTLGQPAPNERPSVVTGLAHFDSLAGAEGAFCGVRNGEVHCWGETWALINGAALGASKLDRINVAPARRVRAARSHACAVLVDGGVTCWGRDFRGALGRVRPADGAALGPEIVRGLPFAIDVVLAGSMTCAITTAREVYCWGSGARGGGAAESGAAESASTPIKIRLED